MTPSAIARRLRAAGCVFAEDEAELLLAEAHCDDELESMVRRRVDGFPLEHILGWAEFGGLRVRVDPGVFVPRRRTEFLAGLAAGFAREAAERAATRAAASRAAATRAAAPRAAAADRAAPSARRAALLDLCCGSGAIAAVVEARLPDAAVYAADLDPAAVHSARRNVSHPDRVFEGDLFGALPAGLAGTFDVIVANTPYVPTDALALMPPEARLHEARFALDGGGDGLDVQRRVATDAPRWLAPGGRLLVEVNEAQAEAAIRLFEAAGLAAEAVSSAEFEVTVVIGRL